MRRNTKRDSLLIGLLNLIHRILLIKPDLKNTAADPKSNNLVLELFRNCLFDLEDRSSKFEDLTSTSENNTALNANYIKCKSDKSRSIAYELLNCLCEGSPGNTQMLIKNGLFDLLKNMPK